MFVIDEKNGGTTILNRVDAVYLENDDNVCFKVSDKFYSYKLMNESAGSLKDALIRGFITNETFKEVWWNV